MNKEEAAQELLNRRTARNSLIEFCSYCNDKYEQAEHLKELAHTLEEVEQGNIKRLIISLPPRHGKSLLTSINFPAWYLGLHPQHKVVITGYSESIASVNSRLCRELFYSEKYEKLFPGLHEKPTQLALQKSAKEWKTKQGGGVYSVGIGGGLTGRGFNIGILDDYLKERKDADSEIQRQRILDWWRSVLYTRQEPDAAIIIISTRWHLQDLIGTLLEEQRKGGEEWELIELPALREVDGEQVSLWPERFPVSKLEMMKQTVGKYEWSSLYMCSPQLKQGQRFKCENIKYHSDINEWPKKLHTRCWDLASSSKQRSKDDPDWTCGVYGCVTKEKGLNHLWIKDVIRIQAEAPKRNETIIKATKLDGASPVYIEAFAAYKDAFTELKNILMGIKTIRSSRPPGDKEVKAAPLEPLFESGNVHLWKANWNEEFVKEFEAFPQSAHDDQVDATSILYFEETKAKSTIIVRN